MNEPHFFDKRLAGHTVQWSGSDSQEQWQYNLKHNHNQLEKNGWFNNTLTYTYNKHGFRDEEFNNRPCGIAFGCSFTSGVGLYKEQTWPYKLSSLLNKKVWNLGAGGESLDTIYRLAEYYIDYFNPEFVCILLPPPNRFELYNIHEDLFQTIMPNDYDDYGKCILSFLEEPVIELNQRKNINAIKTLCNNIPLYYRWCGGFDTPPITDLARDLKHFGESYQTRVADYFYNKYTNETRQNKN